MGADGHIKIWRREDVERNFADCDDLFACLPTHYKHTLDGVVYDHCYWGDNTWVNWAEESDWYVNKTDAAEIARLREFVEWLEDNGTHWEVWT